MFAVRLRIKVSADQLKRNFEAVKFDLYVFPMISVYFPDDPGNSHWIDVQLSRQTAVSFHWCEICSPFRDLLLPTKSQSMGAIGKKESLKV